MSELYWPTVTTLRDIGGSGTKDEIVQAVIERMAFTDAQQAVLQGDGPTTKLEYRLAWALSHLKGMGLTTNSPQAVWSLTERGRTASQDDLRQARSAWQRNARRKKSQAPGGEEESEEQDWREELKDLLIAMSPQAFERLCQRLLREAGFINTQITRYSGDGGIDGLGTYRVSLISFSVYFQCKRYKGSVRASEVRDFRGALQGRGDKGLLITTGTFTAEALKESTRDGAPPIDLVDGDRLCDLLKEYGLGVTRELVQVERVRVNPRFFETI
ncbi:restriction endonuclease [Thermoactinospora rubra]|uniref:restriction endonuclease n=1 Tax=Thermoactinospora rubra TaxID=1088767 RepID=UPI0019821A1A|nr:restriction endonuclease [Thermoactinospora rubra]